MPGAGVAALPRTKLCFTLADGELVPAWLGDRDRPWLRDLIAAAAGFAGRPFADLVRFWSDGEPDPRAGHRHAPAVHVLARWLRALAAPAVRRSARWELFHLAASGVARDAALAEVAARHEVAAGDLLATLYDDLPERRVVTWPDPPPEPQRLALAANTALARGLLRHTTGAELEVHGAARALLKTAWLFGAVPEVSSESTGATLRWRDACSVRAALPRLVPLLPWTRRYRLRASCELPEARGDVVLATGDPLLPGPEPRRFDSDLERTFARDFGRALPRWELLREPTALASGRSLAFPDFELRPPGGGASWLCEIAGLRDRTALAAKVQLLARCPRLVLCLPAAHVGDELHAHPRVVPFRRRVDVQRVRAVIEI